MASTRETELVTKWRNLLACHSDISCALDRELQDAHDIGMSEFEVLDRLSEAVDGELAMHRLAESMYLSQSALSRTVARLERDGLVARTMCHNDRRAVFVSLTEDGRTRHAAARNTHREVLADRLR